MTEFTSNRFFLPYDIRKISMSLNSEQIPNLTLALEHFFHDMTFTAEIDALAFVYWQINTDNSSQLSCYPFVNIDHLDYVKKMRLLKNIMESFDPVRRIAKQNKQIATLNAHNLAFRDHQREIQKFIQNPCRMDQILSKTATVRTHLIAITA